MSFNFHSLQLGKSPESLLSWIITLLALKADNPSGLGQPVGLQRVVRTTFLTKYSIVLEVPLSGPFGRPGTVLRNDQLQIQGPLSY